MSRLFLVLLLFTFFEVFAQTECDSTQSIVSLEILTDDYGFESSWDLIGSSGTTYLTNPDDLQNNTIYKTEICIPSDECMQFIMRDGFGDGLFPPGYYRISLNGESVGSGGEFGAEEVVEFNCTSGQTCNTAIEITEGSFIAPQPETWYVFTPDSSGRFSISTCDATCDTRLYIYGTCNTNAINDDHEGADYYDDNFGGCGENAVISGLFRGGQTYQIRVGQTENSCAMNSIPFSITYEGKLVGCTDPNSCNYNPLAEINDGSCIPQGDPECPNAADLIIREDVLRNTLRLDVVDNSDGCLISEGCLTGYGLRNVLRFDTRIENIGELDYIIGAETENTGQFSFDNCHQHFHYEGYAEYVLFDDQGRQLPASFKNGFCVLDLECAGGGDFTYSCDYMGISAGCEDIYSSELDCQWIDITDLPAGEYTFVTRVNWDNSPDLTRRVEKNIDNNWAQVCFNLEWENETPRIQQLQECEPYQDCNGTVLGDATFDCEGVCGGTALSGDLDKNNVQDIGDVETYFDWIMEGEVATPCYDLNADDQLSVYDAALLNDCLRFSEGHIHDGGAIHEHCNFPSGIFNSDERAGLGIMAVDWEAGTVDIGIVNPQSAITAFQFAMSGMQIASVTSLVDTEIFNPSLRADPTGNTILGLTLNDLILPKSAEMQPLVRLTALNFQSDTICISQIDEIINQRYEQIQKDIIESCQMRVVSSVSQLNELDVIVQTAPNPFTEIATLQFSQLRSRNLHVEIIDINGRLIANYPTRSEKLIIDTRTYAAGLYFYRISDGEKVQVGRLGVKL
ncbi:MAG: lysyl oxidase family protein [Saprospiraceae bacterium]